MIHYMDKDSSSSKRDILENKIIGYFDANSDEELSAKDTSVKYRVSASLAHSVMCGLIEKGILCRRRENTGNNMISYIYFKKSE